MAHYTITNRKSLTTTLEDRYLTKQLAGGAFDAYLSDAPTPGNMLHGLQGELGFTQKSRDWTNEPGFRTNIPIQQTNFNTRVISGEKSHYIDDHGFNNKKYTDVVRR